MNSNSEEISIKNEFAKLCALTEQTSQSKSASLHCNRHKNRYGDVLPNEDTQVKLTCLDGITGSDYINANFVRGENPGSSCFICGQAPLPQTFEDFWRMIWEQVFKFVGCRVTTQIFFSFVGNFPKCSANSSHFNLYMLFDIRSFFL
jgi:protein tyrosine phosphatase